MSSTHHLFKPFASMLAAALVCAPAFAAHAQTEAPEVPSEGPPMPRAPRPPAPTLAAPPPVAPETPPIAPPPIAPPSPPIEPPPEARRGEVAPEPPRIASNVPIVALRPAAADVDAPSIALGARLDFDGGARGGPGPAGQLLVRRARLQATGSIGAWLTFSAAAEYTDPPGAASAVFAPTDVFVALAALRELVVLQAGQFDAPFSLENRTPDYALDFLERSIAVRAFAIPENKATGAMLTGVDDERHFHYALGVFNGDGPGLRNVDGQFDLMARAWLAPFSFTGDGPLHDVSLGGSLWVGDRSNALPLAAQTTTGGLAFARFDPYTTSVGAPPRQLRQVGRRVEAAAELDAPLGHRYGARAELLWRQSPLSEEDVTDALHPIIIGGAQLDGWAAYGEAWFWALGDDRAAPGARHGLQPPLAGHGKPPSLSQEDGLMLALRVSHIDEEVWQETDARLLNLRDPAVGLTAVTSYELGITYWHARSFRATCNYVVNRISGTTAEIKSLGTSTEQELLFRLGIAL